MYSYFYDKAKINYVNYVIVILGIKYSGLLILDNFSLKIDLSYV